LLEAELGPHLTISISKSVKMEESNEPMWTVKARGPRDDLVDLAQELAWLAAVFRIPKDGKVTYSEVELITSKTANFHVRTLELRAPSRIQGPGLCWCQMLKTGIIARGFPIPKRPKKQYGIEIPIEALLKLAHVSYIASYDNGLVLSGFSTMLFPTAQSSELIQWHFVSSKDDHTLIEIGKVLADHDNGWVRISNPEQVRTARTFLGCYRAIQVHLGTKAEDFDRVSYSPLDDDAAPPRLSVPTATFGSSIMGFFTASVAPKIEYPKSLATSTRVEHWDDILDNARDTPIIVYDASEHVERGWMVPELSVILHMVHLWINEKGLQVSLQPARSDWDGGQAAWNIIYARGDLELRFSSDPNTGAKKSFCLKDLVNQLWENLRQKQQGELYEKRKPRGTLRAGNPHLRGWELMDIVKRVPTSKMRSLPLDTDCGWIHFAEAEDILLLVCRDLGEAISLAEPHRICSTWSPMPCKRRFLIASVVCLLQLSVRRGNYSCTKVLSEVYWKRCGKGLFEDCTHGETDQCNKQPQLLVMGNPSQESQPPPLKGAVIFGKVNKLQRPNRLNPQKSSHQTTSSRQVAVNGVSSVAADYTEYIVASPETLKDERRASQTLANGGTTTQNL
jgi:hypothetical protein